jgi:hypothetical protein
LVKPEEIVDSDPFELLFFGNSAALLACGLLMLSPSRENFSNKTQIIAAAAINVIAT